MSLAAMVEIRLGGQLSRLTWEGFSAGVSGHASRVPVGIKVAVRVHADAVLTNFWVYGAGLPPHSCLKATN